MNWIEISVQADGEAAEAVSELFNRLNSRPDGQGGAVIEVGGFDPVGEDHHPFVVVKTYLPVGEPESLDRQREIEEGLWHLGRIYPLGDIAVQSLAEEDWANAWKASYHPLRVGRRFWIVPAWERENVRPEADELPIILDPGMAFGTGLHPSTQLCLCLMEDVVRPGHRVLDAGCGSGILSIAAARLGAARVDAFDIDPIAVRATQENAALNDLPIPVNAVVSSGPGEGLLWAFPDGAKPAWDVILVNILPHVIIGMLDAGLHTYLAPGGAMILAGIIEEREPDVRAALAQHGLTVRQRLLQGDWVGLIATQDSSCLLYTSDAA
ncbi:MAG: 50S ribosomal protein L11 methyltransferase, partial [Anaerolineae bacterium]|nr:50S ribosomal protein L11 methyltransferase [Anaerolineae bacterium]